MNIIVISVLALLVLGIAVMLGTKFFGGKDNDEVVIVPVADCSSCDGTNVKCEQVCQMEAATKPVEYYDDEELDNFKGRPSNSYSDDEVSQFADVLETLRPEDVRPWSRSLILRGISMPDQIKDEFIALAQS